MAQNYVVRFELFEGNRPSLACLRVIDAELKSKVSAPTAQFDFRSHS